MNNGIEAKGQIIDSSLVKATHNSWSRKVKVRYRIRSGEIIEAIARNSADLRIKAKTKVVDDRTDVTKVYLPEETSCWGVPVGILGCGLSGVAVSSNVSIHWERTDRLGRKSSADAPPPC